MRNLPRFFIAALSHLQLRYAIIQSFRSRGFNMNIPEYCCNTGPESSTRWTDFSPETTRRAPKGTLDTGAKKP